MTTFADHVQAVTAERTAVYRFFDVSGQLLYVGITSGLGARFAAHQRTSAWWPDQHSVIVAWCNTRSEALRAERAAIKTERPLWNVAGTQSARERIRGDRLDAEARSEIAANVRAEVARSGISKREVREHLGLSTQAAWQRMCGVTQFREGELESLAGLLGIPVERFDPTGGLA